MDWTGLLLLIVGIAIGCAVTAAREMYLYRQEVRKVGENEDVTVPAPSFKHRK